MKAETENSIEETDDVNKSEPEDPVTKGTNNTDETVENEQSDDPAEVSNDKEQSDEIVVDTEEEDTNMNLFQTLKDAFAIVDRVTKEKNTSGDGKSLANKPKLITFGFVIAIFIMFYNVLFYRQ